MAGVCAENQNCYSLDQAAIFKKCYDDVFEELGMVRNHRGFFCGLISTENKRSRSRAKQKHDLKNAIRHTCMQFILKPWDAAASTSVDAQMS
jgi:hypothetical protein